MRSGASPGSVLVPISQVTGRSVLARSVNTGSPDTSSPPGYPRVGDRSGGAFEQTEELDIPERLEEPRAAGTELEAAASHARRVLGWIGKATGMAFATWAQSGDCVGEQARFPRAGRWSVTTR